MQAVIPSTVDIRYLIARCDGCNKAHFESETYERNGELHCRRTGFVIARIEPPVPIHIYRFEHYRVTITRNVVLSLGRLRVGTTFTLHNPQVVDGHLRVETVKYGVVTVPMSAVRMEPCNAPVEVK